jgi:hypothetical protein
MSADRIAAGSITTDRLIDGSQLTPEEHRRIGETLSILRTYLDRPRWARWGPIGRWWMRRQMAARWPHIDVPR